MHLMHLTSQTSQLGPEVSAEHASLSQHSQVGSLKARALCPPYLILDCDHYSGYIASCKQEESQGHTFVRWAETSHFYIPDLGCEQCLALDIHLLMIIITNRGVVNSILGLPLSTLESQEQHPQGHSTRRRCRPRLAAQNRLPPEPLVQAIHFGKSD